MASPSPRPASVEATHREHRQSIGQSRSNEVECALRAAYASGAHEHVGHRKLVRLIERYLAARPASEFDAATFARWVYVDQTGDDAAWNLDRRAGGRHG